MSDNLMGASSSGARETTIDHDKIRGWAEARAGIPVHATGRLARTDPRTLRIRFPDSNGRAPVEPIQWREWFERFDELGLAMTFEETTADGKPSTVNKLVRRRNTDRH